MRRLPLFLALLVIAAALADWWLRTPAPAPAVATLAPPAPAAEEVWIGQVYAPRLVVLQRAEDAPAAALPPRLELLPLHAAGAKQLPAGLAALRGEALPAVVPQALAGRRQSLAEACAALVAAAPPTTAAAASGPEPVYVPHDGLEDYFDPGLPGHCDTDEGLARYEATADVAAAMPVLAAAGFGPLTADTAVAGTPRPLGTDEQAGVERYRSEWRTKFKEAFGDDYDEKSSPNGPIATLADARQLVVLRDAAGRAVLRVSTWGRVSVAQHLTRVLIVDRLDGDRIVRSWRFARAQGALG